METLLGMPEQLKVIAVAGSVYGLLQALKQIPLVTPYLKGWWAVALNVVLSVAGILSTAAPGTLSEPSVWLSVATAAMGAAGLHGTVSIMSNQPQATEISVSPSPSANPLSAVVDPSGLSSAPNHADPLGKKSISAFAGSQTAPSATGAQV